MKRAGWYGMALDKIELIARRQRFMTSDDLHNEIAYSPPHYNGIGAVMNEAGRLKIIRTTGAICHTTRPAGKRRMVQVWESCLYASPPRGDELEAFIQEREQSSVASPTNPDQGALQW